MTQKLTDPAAIARLDAALAGGELPAPAQATAKKIIDRLKNPVRIAILGLPGSGKSTLLNFLAGQAIMPEDVKLPTLQFETWGRNQDICHIA